jgi:hypothetical protein
VTDDVRVTAATWVIAGAALLTALVDLAASWQHWRYDNRRFAATHERLENLERNGRDGGLVELRNSPVS